MGDLQGFTDGYHGVEAARPRRLVLAIGDGSDVVPGVRAAVAAAAVPGSVVMVVHMAHALVGAPGFTSVESGRAIKETMVEAIRLLDEAGIEALGTVARKGPAAGALAEIATSCNADLIVTGSTSHDLLRAIAEVMGT
jgi:nucleotide-binding universal stress UspA family protein